VYLCHLHQWLMLVRVGDYLILVANVTLLLVAGHSSVYFHLDVFFAIFIYYSHNFLSALTLLVE